MSFDHYQRAVYYAKRVQRWDKVYTYFLRSSKVFSPVHDRIMKDAHYAAIGCAKAAAYHLAYMNPERMAMRSLIEWADGQTTYLDGMTVVDATGSDGLADWEFVIAVPVGGLIEHLGRLGKVVEHEGKV